MDDAGFEPDDYYDLTRVQAVRVAPGRDRSAFTATAGPIPIDCS